MSTTITADDIAHQVATSLDSAPDTGEFDVSAIVAAIIERYDRVNIDEIDGDEYWSLVATVGGHRRR